MKSIILVLLFLTSSLTISFQNYTQSQNAVFDKSLCSKCNESEVDLVRAKVYDGTSVQNDKVRYLASVFVEANETSESIEETVTYTLVCTASIVNAEWILTSANCKESIYAKKFHHAYAAAGSDHSISEIWMNDEYRRIITSYHTPALHKEKEQLHDIALFKLEKPFELGADTNIFPACFLKKRIDKFNSFLFTVGYGAKTRSEQIVDKKTNKTVFSNGTDKNPVRIQDILLYRPVNRPSILFMKVDEKCEDNLICATALIGSLCSGDSGGPISAFLYEYQKNFVVGVNKGQPDKIDEKRSNSTHTVYVQCEGTRINQFMRISFYLTEFIIPLIGEENMCITNGSVDLKDHDETGRLTGESGQLFWMIVSFLLVIVFAIVSFVFVLILSDKSKLNQQIDRKSLKSLSNKSVAFGLPKKGTGSSLNKKETDSSLNKKEHH